MSKIKLTFILYKHMWIFKKNIHDLFGEMANLTLHSIILYILYIFNSNQFSGSISKLV